MAIDLDVLQEKHITVYLRDGKYHWTTKSCGFDTFMEACEDAMNHIAPYESRKKQRL